MAKIDVFLQKIPFEKDVMLLLENDTTPLMISKEQKIKLTNQIFSSPIISSLITELLPLEQKIIFSKPSAQLNFTYKFAEDKIFKVNAIKNNGTLRVIFLPLIQETVRKIETKEIKKAESIYELLEKQIERKASDLHLSSNTIPAIRVDGDIQYLDQYLPLKKEELEAILIPIMPERNLAEFKETCDTDFAFEIPDKARFRVNIFMDKKGIGAVFRLIPYKIMSLDELGLPECVKSLCYLNKGLVLVTGPTGSGKSTTLAAMIDFINDNRHDHIITIEDPIEFIHENKNCIINQREVGSHTDSFKKALRAALREDPDIVLVGEMRDLETVSIALETAETGHLVFGTLHTSTAPSTIDRIIDQFPPEQQAQIRIMLSETLKGIICQTLLKKKNGGRVAAFEILLATNAVSNLIRESKTYQIPSIMQTNKQQGMMLLNDSLIKLVKEGIVAPKEAYLKAVDKVAFLSMLKQSNIDLSDEL